MCSTGFRCARRSKSSCAWYLGKNKGNQSVIFTTIIKHFSSNQVTVIFTTIIKHFYSNQSQSRLKSAFKYLIIFTVWLYNNYVYKMRKNTGASITEMWLPNKTIKIHLNLFSLIIDQVKKQWNICILPVMHREKTKKKPKFLVLLHLRGSLPNYISFHLQCCILIDNNFLFLVIHKVLSSSSKVDFANFISLKSRERVSSLVIASMSYTT